MIYNTFLFATERINKKSKIRKINRKNFNKRNKVIKKYKVLIYLQLFLEL